MELAAKIFTSAILEVNSNLLIIGDKDTVRGENTGSVRFYLLPPPESDDLSEEPLSIRFKKTEIQNQILLKTLVGKVIFLKKYKNKQDAQNDINGEIIFPIENSYINPIKDNCIINNCDKVLGILKQGRYKNCWFNSGLNALLVGQYSRIILLNLLKGYSYKKNINLDSESCPLLNKENLYEILYKTLYLNNYNINDSHLNKIRYDESIHVKNERWNQAKKIVREKLIEKGKNPEVVPIKHGGSSIGALKLIFKKLNLDYDYVQIPILPPKEINFDYNHFDLSYLDKCYINVNDKFSKYYYIDDDNSGFNIDHKFNKQFLLINTYGITMNFYEETFDNIIYEKITLNDNTYFLNSIFLGHRDDDVPGGHATAISICDGKFNFINSWNEYLIKNLPFSLEDLTFKDIVTFDYNKIQPNKKLLRKNHISGFLYVKENNLTCSSFGRIKLNDLEYLYTL
jgi:hypothetical protein